jgi:hypothetical protein
MPVPLSQSLFFHIPKTGGGWVRHALLQEGLSQAEVRCMTHVLENVQPKYPCCIHTPTYYVTEAIFNSVFTFTFIRHPLSWYKSRYAFGIKRMQSQKNAIDLEYLEGGFESFVSKIINKHKDGYVSKLYRLYCDTLNVFDFIGRQENLTEDLITALTLAGEEFCAENIRATARVNASYFDSNLKDECQISSDLEKRLMKNEKYAFELYDSVEAQRSLVTT